MTETSNIVLVGFMGTGKTTVGKLLASELGLNFVDMDDIIVEREKKPISEIFSEDGEPYFRDIERKLSQELSSKSGMVIGAGGGIVLNSDNIADFASTGLVVCLTASPEVILERLTSDSSRPLLEGDDKMKKILSILESRKELYAAIPCQIDRTNLNVEDSVDKIISIYNNQ